jgi:hypothetical protein
MAAGMAFKHGYIDYRPVLFDRLKQIRNGYISIIKQDNRIIQINICDRINTGIVQVAKKR